MKLRSLIITIALMLVMVPAAVYGAGEGTFDSPYMLEWTGRFYDSPTFFKINQDEMWFRVDVDEASELQFRALARYGLVKKAEVCDFKGDLVAEMPVIDEDKDDDGTQEFGLNFACDGDNVLYLKLTIDTTKKTDCYLHVLARKVDRDGSVIGGGYTNPLDFNDGYRNFWASQTQWLTMTAQEAYRMYIYAIADSSTDVESIVLHNMTTSTSKQFDNLGDGNFSCLLVTTPGTKYLIEVKLRKGASGCGVEIRTEELRADAKLSKTNYLYSGSPIHPELDVYNISNPSIKLVEGTDYTVSYSKNVSVGTGTAKITYIGDYSNLAPKTLNFTIRPRGASIRKPYALKKGVKVRWYRQSKKMKSTRITGYQIKLARNSSFTKGVKNVYVKGYKATSKKVGKLSGKKTYYVKIRTYKKVNGKTYYSSWGKVKKVRTK